MTRHPPDTGGSLVSLRRALALSLVAAVLIEVLMARAYAWGYAPLFQVPWAGVLALLGLIALLVYRELLTFARGDPLVAGAGLLGIALALAGLLGRAAGALSLENAVLMVVAAYFSELAVAARLYGLLTPVSKVWTTVFVGGAAVFILSLPAVVLHGGNAVLVSLAGNMVKAMGIAGLLGVVDQGPCERR